MERSERKSERERRRNESRFHCQCRSFIAINPALEWIERKERFAGRRKKQDEY